jgi:hypothetical protein
LPEKNCYPETGGIEPGQIFDNYAPKSNNARSVVDGINKKVGEGQADRIGPGSK